MRRLVCRLIGHDWDLDPSVSVLTCTRCHELRSADIPFVDDTIKVCCDHCGVVLFTAQHVETEWAVDGKPVHQYTYSGADLRRALTEHHCPKRPEGGTP